MSTLTEEAIAALWAQSIRPEDRPVGTTRALHIPRFGTPKGLDKKRAFAAECVPQLEGDKEIIALWGEGKVVTEIAILLRTSEARVRRRLVACHPTATGLL